MSSVTSGENSQVVDSLRVQLVSGETGKVVYDSNKAKPNIGYPNKPITRCFECGGELQPIIYLCKCCGQQFMQAYDFKEKRMLVYTVPETEEQKPKPP